MRMTNGVRAVTLAAFVWAVTLVWGAHAAGRFPAPPAGPTFRSGVLDSPALIAQIQQSAENAAKQSAGCITCHTKTDEASMHPGGTVTIGCADCHGGDPDVSVATGLAAGSRQYEDAKRKAHVLPRNQQVFKSSANAIRPYSAWLEESQQYIQFVNPGDLRVADRTCGSCHAAE